MATEDIICIASEAPSYKESSLLGVGMEGSEMNLSVSKSPNQSVIMPSGQSLPASTLSFIMGGLDENPPVNLLKNSPSVPQPSVHFDQSQSKFHNNEQQTFTYEDPSDNRLPYTVWEWEVTSKHSPISKSKFSHLLPQDPLPSETFASQNIIFQELPGSVKEESFKYLQSIVEKRKIQAKFLCTGWKGKLIKEHAADDETFKRSGMCKECLFGAFEEMTQKQNKQTTKQQTQRVDETMNKIQKELKKLDSKSREDLEKAIPAKYRATGLEMKDRLRGIGMGHHPENKARKLDQFEHNSVLALYGFDVQCVTLVYDHSKKNLFLYGAPEVTDALTETTDRIAEPGKKTHLEAATSLFKTLFKKSHRPPNITSKVQSSATNVWNKAFATKKNAAETSDGAENLVKTSPLKTARDGAEKSIEPSIPHKTAMDRVEKSVELSPPLKRAKLSPMPPINSDTSGQSSIVQFSDFEHMENGNPITNGEEPENNKRIAIQEGIIVAFDSSRCYTSKVCDDCIKKGKVSKLNKSPFPQYCCECDKMVQPVDYAVLTAEMKLKNTTSPSTEKAFIQLDEEYVRDVVSQLPKENQTPSALIGQPIGPMWMELNEEGVWVKHTPVLENL